MRNIEVVELLLDKGAKVSAVDKVLCKTYMLLVLKQKKLVTFLYFEQSERFCFGCL